MIEIKLDKVRRLKFTNEALYEVEDKLGTPAFELMQDTRQLQSVKAITTLVWGGLLHTEDPELTFDYVKKIIPLNNFPGVVTAVMTAMGKALGITDEPVKGKKK